MRAFCPALPPMRRRVSEAAWTPASLSNVIQRFADEETGYHASTINSYPILKPEETGTLAVPRAGRCWTFDGSNDAAVGAIAGTFSTLTYAFWIKPNGLPANEAAMVFNRTTGVSGVHFQAGGSLRLGYTWNSDKYDWAGGPVLTDAVWQHVVVVITPTDVKFYINGVLSVTRVSTHTSNQALAAVNVGRDAIGRTLNGSLKDVLIDDEAYTDAEALNLYTTHTVPTDKTPLAFYRCEEESGLTGYNCLSNTNHLTLANITQSTFHAADTGVKYSFANQKGYTLSGSVVIPASLSTPTQDAAGNALGVTGPVALPATTEVQAFTGDGSAAYVDCGSALIPASADFSLSFWAKTSATTGFKTFLASGSAASGFGLLMDAGSLKFWQYAIGGNTAAVAFSVDVWHYVQFSRSGNVWTLSVDGVSASYTTAYTIDAGNTQLMRSPNGAYHISGSIAGLTITASGLTKYPLVDQCGPGSANTNRDFYIMGSDGSATLVTGGVVGGTIANIYANRCSYVQDWCINYGGGIAANGSFVPGRIGSANDAAGNAKTLAAGKNGNPYSRVVPNVWNAPALVNRGVDSTDKLAPSDTYESITTGSDDGFSRHAADGTDRYFATLAALTGADLTNADAYTA